MTQGYEATHSGKFLEDTLRRELSSRGFHFRTFGEDSDNLDMFAPRVVVSNVPYKSIFDTKSRSEFVINDRGRKIRVECRWQESSGSVDEKFLYLLRNAVEYMPENEVLILYGGNGAREKAVQWLKKEAAKVSAKRIHVININEFLQWVRRELVYDARKDFAGSLEDGYAAIRQRVASGGPGWEPSR
jgi:hypothetical protein